MSADKKINIDGLKIGFDGSTICGNCGKQILPETAVSVIMNGAKAIICHAEYNCSTAGNARYGWWGNGKLKSCFNGIEQC